MSDRELREEAERIERILDEVQAAVGPTVWPRVEELLQRVIGYHGRGLERVLDLAIATTADAESLKARLVSDELAASLMLLHGLHPEPVVDRIERALEEVRPYLLSHGGGVELVAIEEDGTARLRLLGGCRGCPSSRATIEDAIERGIEEAAPEIARVVVEGVDPSPEPLGPLVRLGGRARASWIPLSDLGPVEEGERRAIALSGVHILLLKMDGALYAYRNACADCGARLDDATLEDRSLRCSCGATFDVARAGIGSARDTHLTPLPLLVEEGIPRVALEAV